ncbi:MAG: ATP-binding cassette domain-containing protein [Truepera sp.]|nr:ATP-binding cassette domain-containing protein [Truepera sp.]
MITVERLSKHYQIHEKEPGLLGSLRAFVRRRNRTVRAVEEVSFKIAPGEVVGFLGANGAGKTTTLKMLSGLLHPTSGQVTVADFVPKRRQRAFLTTITLVMGQKQQLDWDLSAADSFLVNQAIYNIPDAVYRQRVAELSELLALDGLLNKQVRKLSLGERMKCELAAALLHQPKVLFLDEPTIGLDVNMQQAVRDFIAEYNARYGATVILTSHYMADVTALARRILVIDQGKLVFDGDFRALVERMAPQKVLKLRLRQPVDAASLSRYATVRAQEQLQAELLVPRQEVARLAAKLLDELPIDDIGIEEVPIEEVIGRVLAGKSSFTAAIESG